MWRGIVKRLDSLQEMDQRVNITACGPAGTQKFHGSL